MSDIEWYYTSQGMQEGPVSWQDLVERVAAERLRPSDLVWVAGAAERRPASTFPGLFPNLPPTYLPPAPGAAPERNRALEWVAPVNRSIWAIAAGYFGLFSLLGCGAPFAIFTGLMALREFKRNPNLGGRGRAIFGLVMGALALVAMIVLFLATRSNP